jgi:hypothetical protein
MNNSSYILRANVSDDKLNIISYVLNVAPTSMTPYWEIEIPESSENYNQAINFFLTLLEKSLQELETKGIQASDFSIWYLYEYQEQCNMEFLPDQLKRLGNIGITLCISCWKG